MWSRLEKIIFPTICSQTGIPCEKFDLSENFLALLEDSCCLCPVCGGVSITNRVCGKCQLHPPIIKKTQVGYQLNDALKQMIHDYKYSNNLFYSRLFSEIITFEPDGIDALIPVPLHLNRLSKRGFNQSLELAKCLGGKYQLPVIEAVSRIVDTPQQVNLSKKQRKQNIKNAFKVEASGLNGLKKIAIVDDVITSGSTINEIARILHKQNSTLDIQAWAIAKTVRFV